MYVQADGNLAYLAHPRTASRATRDALGQRGFIRVGSHHSGPPENELGGRIAFCVVRNHYDSIVSWWTNFNNNTGDLTVKWIRNFTEKHPQYFWPGSMWWFTRLHPRPKILRFENIQADLDAFLRYHGIQPVNIPVIGASVHRKGRDYREFHTPETVALVRELWGDEIDRFGYTF